MPVNQKLAWRAWRERAHTRWQTRVCTRTDEQTWKSACEQNCPYTRCRANWYSSRACRSHVTDNVSGHSKRDENSLFSFLLDGFSKIGQLLLYMLEGLICPSKMAPHLGGWSIKRNNSMKCIHIFHVENRRISSWFHKDFKTYTVR